MGLELSFSGENYTVPQETTYQDFKQALDTELKKSAEGFVRIGYLLKVARDTEILKESGYASVTEFAKAEYNLTPDMVSRFMAINDRYAVGGYSDQLKEKYQKYGYAKLTELLTLPAEIAEEIPAELSRREIQQIKSEYREEQKISDLEVYFEGKRDPQEGSTCSQVVRGYYKDHPEDFLKICGVIQGAEREEREVETKEIIEEWAPSGLQTIITRIPGKGKVMMNIDTAKTEVTITNMRTQEKESTTQDGVAINVLMLRNLAEDPKEAWEKAFGEKFPELAPVQEESKKPERVKTPKKEKKYVDSGGNTVIPAKNPLGNEKKCPENEENAQKSAESAQNHGENTKTQPEPEKQGEKVEISPENTGISPSEESQYFNPDGTPAAVVPDEVKTGQIIGSGTYKPLTEEQKYNRQQNKLDRESKERLREMEEANDLLPSERPPVVHEIRIASIYYDDVITGKKTFELRKNDRGYKVGQLLSMNEFTEGRYTGRTVEAEITYMLEGFAGLQEGYCILGIKVRQEVFGAMNAPE